MPNNGGFCLLAFEIPQSGPDPISASIGTPNTQNGSARSIVQLLSF
jgi:hypothetical protein